MKAEVPNTSTTLLRDVADSQHARWAEFHARYEPMMRLFMNERFPSLDADDVIQETFIALAKALPHYVYNPNENGHFHNYLTGILRNKARKAIGACKREQALRKKASKESQLTSASRSAAEDDYKAWRQSIYEIALQQVLSDATIKGRTKQVFIRVAVNGESPEDVAASFGIERNAVDQIRNRLMNKLRVMVQELKVAGGH